MKSQKRESMVIEDSYNGLQAARFCRRNSSYGAGYASHHGRTYRRRCKGFSEPFVGKNCLKRKQNQIKTQKQRPFGLCFNLPVIVFRERNTRFFQGVRCLCNNL